jgi:hypothetical protein
MKSSKISRIDAPSPKHLQQLADQTLAFFERTAADAREKLLATDSGPEALAAVNTFTAEKELRGLSAVNAETRRRLHILSTEPAIARVVVLEDGRRSIYFVGNATPDTTVDKTIKVVNYRAALGRLAALPVGDELVKSAPSGDKVLEIIEKTLLRPFSDAEGWDARDSRLEHVDHLPKTIVSMRAVAPRKVDDTSSGTDLIDRLLADATNEENLVEGFRRTVITKMGLRNAAALDRFQDEIFRLPLATRLLLIGPPGTGKTTTLIKRLGLKLDYAHLTNDERRVVALSAAGKDGLADSWLMFAPTDLLAQYVKENFAREGIAASNLRIRTWSNFRQDIARNNLGILRTGLKRGGMVMKESVKSVQSATLLNQTSWYSDFEAWQESAFWEEMSAQAKLLSEADDRVLRDAGAVVKRIMAGGGAEPSVLAELMDKASTLTGPAADIRASVEKRAREAFARELTKDPTLLPALAEFVSTLEEDGGEEEDPDVDEDEERPISRSSREAAFLAYVDAVSALARAHVTGRRVSPRSRNGKLMQWIGSRVPAEDELAVLGRNLRAASAVARFTNPLRRYLGNIPSRYRQFRRLRLGEGTWYNKEAFAGSDAHPLEVDLIVLARLKTAATLLSNRRFAANLADTRYATLKSVADLHRTQIAVDEATDFSPVQLACMAALADPSALSFTACGDFLQRITSWGIRSQADLSLIGDVDMRTIRTTYRHSRQLNEFVHGIIKLEHEDASLAELPQHVDNDGVMPALAIGLRTDEQIAEWIAVRIAESEAISGTVPSIAILVDAEERVLPLSRAMNDALSHTNITSVPCQGGLSVGQDNQVRVFDVRHIKGLEFEAVFFVGLDRLARDEPDLLAKYLYVGATRAALFLGLTVEEQMPQAIRGLEALCVTSWKQKPH